MTRWLLLIALCWPLYGVAQNAPSAPQAPTPKAVKKLPTPQPLQTWRTKSGEVLVGSLEDYDFNTRSITIEDTDSARVAIPARELDGESKSRWLQSPRFLDSLAKNYPFKEYAPTIAILYGGLFLVGILVGFFFYWLSVAIIAGNGSLVRALKSYVYFNLAMLLIGLVAIGISIGLARFLPEGQLLPILTGVLSLVAYIGSIAVFCRIVAKQYEVSGCSGCGVLVIWTILLTVVQIGFYFMGPWLLRQPLIDQYFSDYVLEPLGLI